MVDNENKELTVTVEINVGITEKRFNIANILSHTDIKNSFNDVQPFKILHVVILARTI